MKNGYVLKTFAICCCAFVMVYAGFVFTSLWHLRKNAASSNIDPSYQKAAFIKPDFQPGVDHIIRVEIAVKDDVLSSKGQIMEVQFNDETLILRPADSQGRRGSTFLQLNPGNYTIKWKVKNNSYSWPRYSQHKKIVPITSKDLWIHIFIEGKNITIS